MVSSPIRSTPFSLSAPPPTKALKPIVGAGKPASTNVAKSCSPIDRIGTHFAKGLHDPVAAAVEERRRRRRSHSTPVGLMKNRNSTWLEVAHDRPQHGHGVGVEHQYIAPDDGVELAFETEVGRITLPERHIGEGALLGSQCRIAHGDLRSIGPHDFASGADQLCRKKRNVSSAATNVEHTIPLLTPASWKNRPVIGSTSWAWLASLLISRSEWPSSYSWLRLPG